MPVEYHARKILITLEHYVINKLKIHFLKGIYNNQITLAVLISSARIKDKLETDQRFVCICLKTLVYSE